MNIMLFKKTEGLYWDLYVCGKLMARKIVFLKMVCDEPKLEFDIPDGLKFVPMDGELVLEANNMEYYPVMDFYKSDKDSFYGVVAVKEKTDEICGFVCGRCEHERDEKENRNSFYIKYVYVDPESRGVHLSAILIKQLYDDLNIPLHLNVRENNPPALKVYQRCGFHFVSRRELINLPSIHKSIPIRQREFKNNEYNIHV